jgi:autotransporter-associated beta strand protein
MTKTTATLAKATLALLAATALTSVDVKAQSTWSTNASGTNLSTAANWVGGTAPANNTAWVFGSSMNALLNNDFAAGWTNTGMNFSAGASAFTLNGNQLTLNGDITNSSTATQTFGMAMSSSTARKFITSANGGNLVFNGPISFSSTLTFTNTASGPGVVFLNAANSLTGTLDAQAPYTTVVVGNTGALGNAVFRGNAGSTFSSLVLSVAGGGTLANSIGGAASTGGTFNLVSDRPTPGPGLTYTVNGTITNGSSQSTLLLQKGGNVTSGSPGLVLNSVLMGGPGTGSNLQTVNALSADVTINTLAGNNPTSQTNATMPILLAGWTTNNKVGAINNGGSNNNIMILNLYKAGPGTWTMTGSNGYTGFTAIQGGTLAADYTTNATSKLYSRGVLVLGGGNLAITAGSGTETVTGVQTTGGQNQVIAAAGTKINLGNLTTTNNQTSVTGSWVAGSSTITGLSSTSGLAVGQTITGTGIPTGATIIRIIDSTTIQTSTNAASGGTSVALGSGTFTAGGSVNFAGAGTITTTSANTGGILGGRLTINGTDFAANDGSGNIVAYTGYTNLLATGASNSASTNYILTGGSLSAINGYANFNTLKIASSTGGSQTLTIPSSFTQARYGALLYTGSDTLTLNTVGSTFTNTVGLTTGSTTVNVTNTVGAVVGQSITGTGVPLGAYITAIDSVNNTITLSAAATATASNALTYNGGKINASDTLRLNNWGNGLLVLGSIGSGFEKYGTGTIQLSQPAQTTGSSSINGGAVIISNNNQLTTPGSSGVINAVGGLTINGGALIADTTSGNNVTLDNAGNTGTNMRTIAVGLNGATFDVLGNGTLVISGSISSVNNNGTAYGPITFGSSNTTGSFNIAGSGTQSYYNTFAGGVILGGGTLQLNKGETAALGYTNVYTGTSGSAVLTGLTNTAGLVVGQPVSGTGILGDTFIRSIDSSTGITLSKALNAASAGNISISANMGALGVNSNVGGSTAQNFIYFQGGTLQYSAANTNDYSSRFAKYGNQQYKIDTAGQNVTFNNPLYGGNSVLTKYGAGTLTLAGGGAYDPYTGGTVINAGTVKLANQTAVVAGPLTLADSTLFDLAGNAATVTGLSAFSTLGVISNSSSTNATLTVSNNTASSYAGTLAGGSALSLTKSGTGTLTLAGNNAYSGPTLVSGGQLAIPTGNGITNSTVTVSSAGSLSVASGGSVNAVTNSGSVQLFGTAGAIVNNGALSGTGTAGALTLNAGSTITSGGATGITSGTLTVSSLVINGGTYNWNLQNSDQWSPAWDQIAVNGNVTFSLGTNKFTIGLVTNATTLWDSSKSQDFTLITSGGSISGFDTNSFALPVSTTGKWSIGSSGSSIVMSYLVNNSAISLVAESGVIVTQDSPYSGDSSTPVIKTGAGEFVLNQSNDIQGGVTIASGTLTVAVPGALGTSSGVFVGTATNGGSNAVLNISAAGATNAAVITAIGTGLNVIQNSSSDKTTLSGPVSLTTGVVLSSTTSTGNLVLTGAISGSNSVTVTGPGTVTLSGASSYAGGTVLNGSTLALGNNAALGSGTLSVTASSTIQAASTVSATNAVALSSGVRATLDSAGNALTASGNISGAGSVGVTNSTGSGSVTLSGSNSYAGGTMLNGGALVLARSNALGSGTLTINAGTVKQSVANALANPIQVNASSATLDLGAYALSRTSNLSGSGSLSITNSGGLTVAGSNSYSGTIAVNSGNLTVSTNGNLGNATVVMNAAGPIVYNYGVMGGVTVLNNGNSTWSSSSGAQGTTNLIGSNSTFLGPVFIGGPAATKFAYGSAPNMPNGGGSNYAVAAFYNGVTATNVTVNGRLDLLGNGSMSISGISGTSNGQTNWVGGGSGAIVSGNTYAATNAFGGLGNVYNFTGGSAFSGFYLAKSTFATLTQSGTGTTSFGIFGQLNGNNTALPTNNVTTISGGNWAFGQLGQNNGSQMAYGTFNVNNGANISVGGNTGVGNTKYSHGFWNINNGSMTFVGDVAQGGGGDVNNNDKWDTLQFNVASNGVLNVTNGNAMNGGLQLGVNAAGVVTNPSSLTVNGGTANIAGSLSLGNAANATNGVTNNVVNVTLNSGTLNVGGYTYVGYGSASGLVVNEQSTVTINGGKFLAGNVINAPSVLNSNSSITSSFIWNGGQITAASITAANTNWNGVNSSIRNNTLSNTNGTLAPGDLGTAGLTTITGSYIQSGGNSKLSLDLNGINKATSFVNAQTNGGYYDALNISGGTAVFSNTTIALNPNWYALGGGVSQMTLVSGASALTMTNVTYAWADGSFGKSNVSSDNAISITLSNSSTILYANVSFNMWTNGLGNWGTGGTNAWTRGVNPNGTSSFAAFGSNALATLDQNATVRAVSFLGTNNSVTSAEGAVLTLDSADRSGVSINNNTTGTNNLGVAIVLNDSLRLIGTGYLNISGNISGTNGVTAAGTGAGNNSYVMALTGNNSYSGPTVINSGALQATYNPNTTISNASGTTLITVLGGANGWSDDNLTAQASGMSNSTLAFDASRLDSAYTVNQNIFTNGAATLTLGTYGTGTVALAPGGNYSSVYRINANGGTLDLGGNTLANRGATFNAGTVLNGSIVADSNSVVVTNIVGGVTNVVDGVTNVVGGSNVVTTNNYAASYIGNGSVTIAANLGGNAGFTSQGGNVTLSGNNTYTGATVLSGGLLRTVLNTNSTYATTNSGTTFVATIAGPNGNWTGDLLSGIADQMTNSTLGIDGDITLSNITNSKGGITLAAYSGTAVIDASKDNSGIAKVSLNGGTLDLGGSTLNLSGATFTEGTLNNGVLNNSGAYTANNSNTVTVAANLGGAGTLTMSGTGSLYLNGNNTHGRTILNSGTVVAGSSTALGSGSLSVNGGLLDENGNTLTPFETVSVTGGVITNGTLAASVNFTGTTNAAIGSVIADTGVGASSLTVNGNGTLALTGNNTFTGGSVLTKGTLQITAGGALGTGLATVNGGALDLGGSTLDAGQIVLNGGSINNGSLASDSGFFGLNAGTVNAGLSGYGQLRKTNTGWLTLNGQNTYSGATILEAGTLQSTFNSNTAAYVVSPGATLVATVEAVNPWTADQVAAVAATMSNATIGVDASGSTETFSLAGLQNANGGVILGNYGTGTLALASGGDFSGVAQLSVNGGLVDLGGGTLTTTGAYGTNLAITGGVLTNGTVVANSSVYSSLSGGQTATVAADLSGSGSLSKYGAGTLVITGSNSLSGGTFVNNGTLVAASANALGSGSVSIGSTGPTTFGTLDLGGTTLNADSQPLSMTAGVLTNGSVTAETSLTNLSGGTIAAPISGAASIVKGGSGTLTLATANAYTGGTVVNSGALVMGNASALGSGSVTVSGGALNLGGNSVNLDSQSVSLTSGSITNGTVSSATAFDSLANGTVSASLTGAGSLTHASGTLTLSGNNSYSGGSYVNGGALVLGSATANGSGPVVVRGGALDLGGLTFNVSTLNATLNSGTVRNGTITSSGNFDGLAAGSGTVSAALSGTGSLTVGSSSTLTLAGANGSWSGKGYLNGGKLILANSNAIGTGGLAVKSSSVLAASTNLTTTGTISVTNGTTLTVDASGKSLGLAGVISGSGAVVVSNSVTGGSVTLSAGNNTFNGGLTVASGYLNVASNSTTYAPITVSSSYSQFAYSPTAGSNVLTVSSGASNLVVGQSVSGSYIPAGAVITAIDGNTVTISTNIATNAPTNSYGGLTYSGAYASGVLSNSGTLGNVTVSQASSLTAPNFYNKGTVAGTLTVAAPIGGSAAFVYGNNSTYAGYAMLDSGSVVTGAVVNGRLDIVGSGSSSISGIGSSGYATSGGPANLVALGTNNTTWGTGMIVNNSTAGNTVTFTSGSSFSLFQKGSSNNSTTSMTLAQSSGSGTVSFAGYGYNPNAVNALYTFANGNWQIGSVGQNNSNTGDAGTNVIEGGSKVSIVSDATRTSGTWVVNNGSLSFSSAVAEGFLYDNNSLNVTVNTNGALNAASGYGMGSYGTLKTGSASPHVLTINGGSATIGGTLSLGQNVVTSNESSTVSVNSGSLKVANLSMGSASLSQFGQSNTVNLGGGSLTVTGTLSASSNATAISQANTFNWTGGTLSARTIDATSPNWTGGNISGGALTQEAGTLAVSSNGTTVIGDYNLNGGTVALAIGNGALAVTGTANLGSGTLVFSTPNYFSLYKAGSGTTSIISAGTALNNNGVTYNWLGGQSGSEGTGLNGQVGLQIVSGSTNLDAVTSVNAYQGGAWNQTASWTRGIVPNGQDYFALIGSSNNVSIDDNATVSDLRLGDGNILRGAGTLSLTPWSSINGNAAASVALAVNSTNTISAPLALSGNAIVSGTNGSSLNITGGLSGNGTLTFNTGSFTLSGDTHTGGTILNKGTLWAGYNPNISSITVATNVGNSASLIVPVASANAGDNWTVGAVAAQAASMTNASFQIDTTGTNFIIGSTGLTNAGQVLTLSSYGTGTLSLDSGVTSLAGVAKLQVNGNGGAFDLGGNSLALSGASNTTTVDVYAGSLQNGTITTAGLIRNNSWDTNVTRISANLAGTGSYSKGGTGVAYLSGNNTFTGGASVTSGTLVAETSTALGSGAVSVRGGTLDLAGNGFTMPGEFTMTAGGITNGSLTAANYNLSGCNVGSSLGEGIANITGLSSNVVTVTGSLGASNVNITANGTLFAASSNALAATATVNFGAAGDNNAQVNTLDIGGHSLSVSSLNSTGPAAARIVDSIGGADLTLTGNSVFGGVISHTGATTLAKDATLNLGTTGSLASTPTVNVNGGTLLLGADSQVNASADLNLNGGTVSMGGGTGSAGTVSQAFGSLTMTADSTIDFIGLAGSSFTVNGAFNLSNGILSIHNWKDGNQLILSLGSSSFNGDLANIQFFSGTTQDTLLNGAGFIGNEIVPVPEPGVVITGLLMVAWMLFAGRRRIAGLLTRRMA